jgi:hypothetical protein
MSEFARRGEPILEMENIQGNVVAGFRKDFQTLLFFRIDDAKARFGAVWFVQRVAAHPLDACFCPMSACGT